MHEARHRPSRRNPRKPAYCETGRPYLRRTSGLADKSRARLIGTVRDERAQHATTLRFDDVSERAIDHLKLRVAHVNWFSTYHVHHRVTEHFRKGRAFLLG